jgi:hypothetical protein
MLHAEIKKVLKFKKGGFIDSAEVSFFGINTDAYVKTVDFSFSPSLSDQLSADEKVEVLCAEREFYLCKQ